MDSRNKQSFGFVRQNWKVIVVSVTLAAATLIMLFLAPPPITRMAVASGSCTDPENPYTGTCCSTDRKTCCSSTGACCGTGCTCPEGNTCVSDGNGGCVCCPNGQVASGSKCCDSGWGDSNGDGSIDDCHLCTAESNPADDSCFLCDDN
jgi:hypothetical protein